MSKKSIIILLKRERQIGMHMLMLILSLFGVCHTNYAQEIVSPNQKIKATISLKKIESGLGQPVLDVSYIRDNKNVPVFSGIELGIQTDQRDFSKGLTLVQVSEPSYRKEEYQMLVGKRSLCFNEANERVFTFANPDGQQIGVTVRAYNDGITFKYDLQALANESVTEEHTVYPIANGVTTWMQPYKNDYEGFYDQRRSNEKGLWGYPSLIKTNESVYTLITEANITRGNCGTQLDNQIDINHYKVRLGDDAVALNGFWESPWRVLMIGSLADIVESTLVTDVSAEARFSGQGWVVPGNVSWIYWAYNHSSNDFQKVKEYIDLAAKMGWEYSLIDWKWDGMSNGGNVEDAIQYSLAEGIKPLLWYNSGTGWIGEGAPGPLDRLNNRENRLKEYEWLQKLGVAGIKVDFFDGDDVEMMDYYQDLLEDAAKFKLMVNLHGSTLPRGWERTYPNLMTMEAVYGAEWYNNNAILTDRAAVHNATLPFTRNVVGSMDYTPGTFSDSQFKHVTSHAHELALMIAFESAWQHRPDRPETYASLPAPVQTLLSALPTAWDDTKLLSGNPGEDIVIARRKGNTWYVAGLNGSNQKKDLQFDLSQIAIQDGDVSIISDGTTAHDFSFSKDKYSPSLEKKMSVPCLARGGFVAILNEH